MKIGRIAIAENFDAVSYIVPAEKFSCPGYRVKETVLIRNVALQMEKYFEGELKVFDLPLEPEGTEFQRKVWNALLKIPYGETRSYKQIAETVGNPAAGRAVGGANNKNPLMIVIPCHRVIGADKSLVGYGWGLELKKFLLDFEKINS